MVCSMSPLFMCSSVAEKTRLLNPIAASWSSLASCASAAG